MKKVDRRIVIIASLIFILGMAFGLMKFLISMREDPPSRLIIEARRYVKVEPVKYGNITSSVSAPGRLSSVTDIDLVAEAAGKIEPGSVPLKKGIQFKKGDVLFVIYPDEASLALKASKSRFLNVLANLLPDVAIDFPDYEEGFRIFFSSVNIDKPLPEFPEVNDEKFKIFLASRNVFSEYYNITKDELQFNRRTLIASFNGTLTDVYMEVGAYTNTGGRIARAIRTDMLELEVPLERMEAMWVNIGDVVTIRSDKRSLTWNGVVIRKSQFVDENTQSQEIFIRIMNHRNSSLLTGEYLVAEFPGHPVKSAMEIPRNSVFNTNEVFIVKEGRLKKEMINIIKVNPRTLIFNGLPEGDTLVFQQLINVSEGTLVQVEKESAGPKEKKPGPAQDQQKKQRKSSDRS